MVSRLMSVVVQHTCNKVRELFLERNAIFQVPLQLRWCQKSNSTIDDLCVLI